MILDLFIFFVVYYLSFISIYSYGKYFTKIFFGDQNLIKSNKNDFIYIFYGISFFILLSWIYYFSFGLKSEWFNLILILFGIILFFFDKDKTKKPLFYFVPLILFSAIVIYNNHNDYHLYHFQNIVELTDSFPKIGLGNLNAKYVYSSIYIYYESIFNFPTFKYQFFNIPRFLLFISICGYLTFNLVDKNSKSKHFLSAIFLIFILLKFKRFSEHGYDYLVIFFIMFIFVEYFYQIKKKLFDLKKILFLFAITVLIKVTALFFFPFIVYSVLNNYFYNKNLNIIIKNSLPALLISIVFFANSFLNSGCIFYSIQKTCIDHKNISWSIKYAYIENEKKVAEQWSKGFFHQKNKDKILNYDEYIKNGKWIFHWFNDHFKNKIIEPILIYISIIFIFYFISRSNQKIQDKDYILLFPTIISLSFWFFSLPQLRFGYFYILLLIYLVLNLFFKKEILINYKTKLFIILSFIFFNIHNVNRIYNEFKENSNFPWYETIDYKTNEFKMNNISYYHYARDENFLRVGESKKNIDFKYNLLFSNHKIEIKKKNNLLILKKSQ